MRLAIIDSSPLIVLTHLQLASKLSIFFDRILVPRRVQEEVNRKNRFRRRLNKLFEIGLFERCNCADQTRVRILLLGGKLGPGESEGLVQAQEKGASFFIADETLAREQASRQGLSAIGSTRILARLSSEGYAEDVWSLVARVRRDLRFRIDDKTVNAAITEAALPIGIVDF